MTDSRDATEDTLSIPLPILLFRLISVLADESERGCALVAAASIDEALVGVLRAKFKHESGVSDKHIDTLLTRQPLPPLGSLSVRTSLAYALGLIDDQMRRALKEIREMRNAAAHLADDFTLDDYELPSLLEPLSEKDQQFVRLIAAQGYQRKPRRLRFEFSAMAIYATLLAIAQQPDKAPEISTGAGLFDHLLERAVEAFKDHGAGSSDDSTADAQT